jgi:hypothetical protein
MLELMLCSMLTLLPDFLIRRFVQGKRLGRKSRYFRSGTSFAGASRFV